MRVLAAYDTWDLVDPPKHCTPIDCKWIYKVKYNKVKYNTNGSVNQYNARLVTKGYEQTHGIDYGETFVSVAKMTTVRVVLVVASAKEWRLHQMGVKNAFL